MRIHIYIFFLLCSLSTSAFSYPIATDKIEGSLSALPFASWFAEPESTMGITKASDPEMQKNFLPVSKGFSFKEKGAGWLRLEFKKTSPASGLLAQNNTGDLFLKVGVLPAGTSTIYYQDNLDPTKTPGIWFATALHAFESRQLPEPPLSGNTVYIHFEETPGLWFAPLLEKNTKNPLIFPLDTVLAGLLLCGVIVCLLRAIKDKALWPLWASFLLGLGLIQTIIPLPLLHKQLEIKDLPPLIAPGLCLIVFSHLARLMLRTKETSPAQDAFLKFFPFFGVIVSLVPLLPEYSWVTRLFPLWALFLFPLLPISLGALGAKKQGSLIFTGACLLPVLGAIWSLSSLFIGEVHPLAEHGGLWGLAIGGIFLFLAGVPKEQKSENSQEKKEPEEEAVPIPLMEDIFPQLDEAPLTTSPASIFSFADEPSVTNQSPEKILAETMQKSSSFSPEEKKDKNQKNNEDLAKESFLHESKEHHLSLEEATQKYGDSGVLAKNASFDNVHSTAPLQTTVSSTEALGGMSALFHEDEISSPLLTKNEESHPNESKNQVAARKNIEATSFSDDSAQAELHEKEVTFTDNLADSIANTHELPIEKSEKETAKVISLESEDFSDTEWERQASLMRASVPVGESYIFNLHALIREVHNTAIPLAEDKDILLSWFISPSLPSFLKGDVVSLRQSLSLLVQNAVQATNKGAVQLFVKHAPTTTASDLGRLQFTISDTGVAQRADSGFFHAWELAQRTGGCFSIEYSVSGGTLVIFSVKFEVPSDELLQQHLSSLPEENIEEIPENPHESYSKAFPLTQQMLKTLDIHSPEAILDAPFDTTIETDLDSSVPLFIITDMTISNKRLLSHYLSVIPHSVIDPKSIVGVIEIVQKRDPALIIYDADSPEDMIISSIRAVIEWRKQQGLALLPQLVIAGHEGQAKRMQKAGATKVLLKPFPQESILEALHEFFPLEKEALADLFEKSTEAEKLYQEAIFAENGKQQEEKNSENTPEQKEHAQENTQDTSFINNKEVSPQKVAFEETMNTTPLDRVFPEEDSHVAPLLQSLRQEDLQLGTSISQDSQEQLSEQEVPQKKVEKSTNTIQVEAISEQNTTAPLDKKERSEEPSKDSKSAISSKKKETKTEITQTPVIPPLQNKKDDAVDQSSIDPVSLVSPDQSEEKKQESHPVSKLEETSEILFGPIPTGSYPLPRMDGEAIEVVMLPLVPGLLNTLQDALADSVKARKDHQTIFVQEAVSRLANKAEVFGLTRLGKIGRCVERAAEADDFEAVDTLLDDLIAVTERYIESLKECYESFLAEAR